MPYTSQEPLIITIPNFPQMSLAFGSRRWRRLVFAFATLTRFPIEANVIELLDFLLADRSFIAVHKFFAFNTNKGYEISEWISVGMDVKIEDDFLVLL